MLRDGKFIVWALTAGCSLSWSAAVRAAGPLGGNGDPIRTSEYKVDLTQGPVLASSRVTGLAGAYVAIAEGTDGNTQNPAAPAVRYAYSYDYFDYDLGLGVTLASTLRNTDFFNTGKNTQLDSSQQGYVFLTPALNLSWGDFGLGLTLEFSSYALRQSNPEVARSDTNRLSANFVIGHLQLAEAFFNQQLTIGFGVRVTSLSLSDSTQEAQGLFSTEGAGSEVGLLYRPNNHGYRMGIAFRSAVTTKADANSVVTPDRDGDRVAGGGRGEIDAIWLPNQVTLPWDLNLGIAFQFGPRPFNPVWHHDEEGLGELRREFARRQLIREGQKAQLLEAAEANGEAVEPLRQALIAEDTRLTALEEYELNSRERRQRRLLKQRHRAMGRPYLLVTTSVLLTGAVDEAVGVESFLSRVVDRSGQQVVASPRIGLETEAVPNWVRVRGGGYTEPTRFAGSSTRLHGTVGVEVKVFPWSVFGLYPDDAEWRISGSLDVAQRYLGWGLAIGNWH